MEIPEKTITLVCSGDERAYAELFERSWDQAVRTCLLILRNQHDAEETAQDAFLKLYLHRQNLRDRQSFRSWFYRLLVNTALDRLRKRKTIIDIDSVEVSYQDRDFQRAEQRLLIDQAMKKLSPEERTAIVLVHFNGCTEVEAADAIGWKLGKLKYRLNRARRVLSNAMGEGNQERKAFSEEGTLNV